MKVRVYRNLNAGRKRAVYSVVDVKTGRVVAHAWSVSLVDVKFVVRPGGHARAQTEMRRNVHAFAVGTLTGIEFCPGRRRCRSPSNSVENLISAQVAADDGQRLTYNPFGRSPYFSNDYGAAVKGAAGAVLTQFGLRCWSPTILVKA